MDPVPSGVVLGAIGWELMPAVASAVALFAAVAEDSGWEKHGPVDPGV